MYLFHGMIFDTYLSSSSFEVKAFKDTIVLGALIILVLGGRLPL
jgi:hypothetical protein